MAAALQYLQENGIAEYGQLAKKATKAADRFHTLEWQLKGIENDMNTNAELWAAVVKYARTRPVFDGYKAAKYSKKYLAEHGADIAAHRAARATFTRLLGGGKLPRMEALKKEHAGPFVDKMRTMRFDGLLTREVVDALIDRVLVYGKDHIEIMWKFSDAALAGMMGKEETVNASE